MGIGATDMTEYQTHAALVQSLEAEVSRLLAINAELRASIQNQVQVDTSLEQAARQALEALEQLQGGCTDSNDGTVEAITVWCPEIVGALREALEAAPQQEPVAWAVSYDGKTPYTFWHKGQDEVLDLEVQRLGGSACKMPLYTAPQPKAEPSIKQELTDPENQPNQYGVEFLMRGPKMAFRVDTQQFTLDYEPEEPGEFEFMRDMLINAFSTFTPDVNAPQPARQPLTDEQIADIYADNQINPMRFARAIEAAHGIGQSMTALEQAARQALEALEHVICWDNEKPEWEYAHVSITALREALEDLSAPVFSEEDHVLVPRGLIGAACSAIDKKRAGAKTLAELRRYTTGDLSKAARQPLTDEEICAIFIRLDPLFWDAPTGFELDFARAIEKAHGIGGVNHVE